MNGLRKFAYLFGLMRFVKIFIKDTDVSFSSFLDNRPISSCINLT